MNSKPPYTLYYWSLPFRGQFIRAILSYAGQAYDEPDDKAISALMKLAPDKQPYPFMGPPFLVDHEDGSTLAQMPAIALYLGDKFGLMPSSPIDRARAIKIINDANDVIDELTLDGGSYRMWDDKLWHEFQPRLKRWMAIFEATARQYRVEPDAGHLLGGDEPSIADVVTATLWGTMTDQFAVIGKLLDENAPLTASLARRINGSPKLAALRKESARRYGDQYCGGEIEKSLRAVVK